MKTVLVSKHIYDTLVKAEVDTNTLFQPSELKTILSEDDVLNYTILNTPIVEELRGGSKLFSTFQDECCECATDSMFKEFEKLWEDNSLKISIKLKNGEIGTGEFFKETLSLDNNDEVVKLYGDIRRHCQPVLLPSGNLAIIVGVMNFFNTTTDYYESLFGVLNTSSSALKISKMKCFNNYLRTVC